MTAVALLYRAQILEQVSQGRYLQAIAEDLGISAPSISKQLATDPEYQQAREIGAELRLHLAASRLDQCAEGEIIETETGERVIVAPKGKLAHAREAAFRAAAWFAEREFPGRWGQKVESKADVNISVRVVRYATEALLIEQDSLDAAEPTVTLLRSAQDDSQSN